MKHQSKSLRLLLTVLVLTVILFGMTMSVASAEPVVQFTSQDDKVTLDNKTGVIEITGSHIKELYVTGDETQDQSLMLIISSDSVIGAIYLQYGAFVRVADGAEVDGISVSEDVEAYIDGTIDEVTLEAGTYAQLGGQIGALIVGEGAFVDVKQDAKIETIEVSDGEKLSVVSIGERAAVASVTVDGQAQISGVGFVDEITAGADANVSMEATITRSDGKCTDVVPGKNAKVSYVDDCLFTMSIARIGSLGVATKAAVPVKVTDVIGERVSPKLSVSSSNPAAVTAGLEQETIHLTRVGDGKAIITVTAEMPGYQRALMSFCVYLDDKLAEEVKAIESQMSQPQTKVETAGLSCGNACNKSMKPGDVSSVTGIVADEGAKVTVVSSNPTVAGVSALTGGSFTVTAKAEGMTAITITASRQSTSEVTYMPTVRKILVLVDEPEAERIQLSAVAPSEADLRKVYDGTCALTLPRPKLIGVADGDSVYADALAYYTDAAAGKGKEVHIVYHLYGENANEYLFPADTVVYNGVITKRALNIVATPVPREFIENNTKVELTDVRCTNKIPGDVVFPIVAGAYGSVATPDVEKNKPVTLSPIQLGGADAGNYTPSYSTEQTVTILKQQVPVPVQGAALTFNNRVQTANIPLSPLYTVTGNTATAQGDYTAAVALNDTDSYRWADSDSEPITVDWTINRKSLNLDTVSFGKQTFTGSAINPDPDLSDADLDAALVRDRDYTLAYENNSNAGSATIIITGIGNYCDDVRENFTIDAKKLTGSNVSFGAITAVNFSGSAITPKPAVTDTDRDVSLVEGTDYTYTYADNTDEGTATVSVVGMGNYANTVSTSFSILPKPLTTGGFTVSDLSPVTYSGSPYLLEPVVTDKTRNVVLVKGTDYTLGYSGNQNAGTAVITISGINNYSSSLTKNFTINKALPTVRITSVGSGVAGTSVSLTGTTDSTAAISWTLVSGTTNSSVSGSTLHLGYLGNNTVRASVAETANYLSASATKVIASSGAAPVVTALSGTPGTSFDSSNRALVTFASQVSNPAGVPTTVTYSLRRNGTSGSFVYTNGSTATTARMAVGSYTLTCYARNCYGTGTKSVTVTVNQSAAVPSSEGNATGYGCDLTVINSIANGTMTGYSFQFVTSSGHSGSDTWSVTAYFTNGSSSVILSGTASNGVSRTESCNLSNIDRVVFHYEVDNTHQASCLGTNMTASINVSIPNNDTQDPTLENDATISTEENRFLLSDNTISVADVAGITFDGAAKTPVPVVRDTFRNTTLAAGTDFTCTYENNRNPGQAKITITGIGNYAGTLVRYFTIAAIALSESNVTVGPVDDVVFTGAAFTPTPAVSYNNGSEGPVTLTAGTHFVYRFSDNTNVGEATVTIEFKNEYAGEVSVTFTISACPVTASNATVTGSCVLPETGGCCPALTITAGTRVLLEGTDYTCQYSDNTQAGQGSVLVICTGNYSGQFTKTFTITEPVDPDDSDDPADPVVPEK